MFNGPEHYRRHLLNFIRSGTHNVRQTEAGNRQYALSAADAADLERLLEQLSHVVARATVEPKSEQT